MRNKGTMAIVTAMVLGLASIAVAQQNNGKAVHITLKAPAQVGSTTLPAGDYEVTHLYSQTGHYMEFARDTQSDLGFEGSPTYYEREIVARVDCTMQPASARISKTAIEKEGARVARLEIKGESVVHNF